MSPDGIKPIKCHIHTIFNIPNPKTVKQQKHILGNFNYCAKFVKDHAAVIALLSELTKGRNEDPTNVPIILTAEALEAIKTIKEKLTQTPVLGFPDFYSG